jgi:low affinity Fe/Cu permease
MKKLVFVIEKKFQSLIVHLSVMIGHSFTFFIAIVIVLCWISIDVIQENSLHTLINDLIFSFTFLMIFVLQRMQNKFSVAINMKLNELVASNDKASNGLINAEDMSKEQLHNLAIHYDTISDIFNKDEPLIRDDA